MAKNQHKAELVMPAGDIESLRAAVANGADAVYFGLKKFNARQFAGNFDEKNVFSAVKHCHDHGVKVYMTFNTLIKNSEIRDFLSQISVAVAAGTDAVIVQDVGMIPVIKANFPGTKIHLSTQATVTNEASIPEGVDMVVLARELPYEEIKKISQKHRTEVFVHGALCFSYSGQCLFSSMAGGRSGNRGKCAQSCRRKYNNKYAMSTMDLCMLEKIPELIEAGVSAFKVEGRMRGPLYTATVARIYRKAIDSYYSGKFSYSHQDIVDLQVAFNRGFTQGFAYSDSIVDAKMPMNRGLYLGVVRDGNLLLKEDLKIGDGISVWSKDKTEGHKIKEIVLLKGGKVAEAHAGDIIEIDAPERAPVYKTYSVDLKYSLGDELPDVKPKVPKVSLKIPALKDIPARTQKFQIFAKAHSKQAALDLDEAGADVVYYDIMKENAAQMKLQNAKLFVYTPRILSDSEVEDVMNRINKIKPDGVLVSNRGLLKKLANTKLEIHLDYTFNVFNDLDLMYYHKMFSSVIPIASLELSLDELSSMHDKNFIVFAHGDIVLMNTKEKLRVSELVDEEDRHFKVRREHGVVQVLNSNKMGLFNKVLDYQKKGIRYFYIDEEKEPAKFVSIYRRILLGENFDDKRIRKGYTTGHFARGV